MTLFHRIRQVLIPLFYTSLHPQWLVWHERRHTKTTLINLVCGKILDIGYGNRCSESEIDSIDSYTGPLEEKQRLLFEIYLSMDGKRSENLQLFRSSLVF